MPIKKKLVSLIVLTLLLLRGDFVFAQNPRAIYEIDNEISVPVTSFETINDALKYIVCDTFTMDYQGQETTREYCFIGQKIIKDLEEGKLDEHLKKIHNMLDQNTFSSGREGQLIPELSVIAGPEIFSTMTSLMYKGTQYEALGLADSIGAFYAPFFGNDEYINTYYKNDPVFQAMEAIFKTGEQDFTKSLKERGFHSAIFFRDPEYYLNTGIDLGLITVHESSHALDMESKLTEKLQSTISLSNQYPYSKLNKLPEGDRIAGMIASLSQFHAIQDLDKAKLHSDQITKNVEQNTSVEAMDQSATAHSSNPAEVFAFSSELWFLKIDTEKEIDNNYLNYLLSFLPEPQSSSYRSNVNTCRSMLNLSEKEVRNRLKSLSLGNFTEECLEYMNFRKKRISVILDLVNQHENIRK